MSLNNTFKYHFTLKKEKKNKFQKCPIYLRILVNGKRSSLSTNQYIKESFWLGGIKKPTKDKELNKVLKSIERKLINTYNRLINLDKEITCRSIKDELIGKKKKIHTIISAFEFHNKNMESLLGTKYAWGTYKNYRSTLKSLKQFIPQYYNVKDIDLNNLDFDFIQNYEHFLTISKNCTNNGVMKQMQRLRKVLNLSIANSWIEKNPFVKYKIRFEKVDRGYLSNEELESIERLELKGNLALVRDCFVFSCYTGLAYADLKKLSQKHIKIYENEQKWIVINRTKTDFQAMIPILPEAEKLLVKYCNMEDVTKLIFPIISNQKTNDNLKVIARLVRINKRVSFHLARHTFATTVTLSKGVPIETVSKMLGHNKITTTQIYSRVLKGKIFNDMKNRIQ